MTARGPQGLRDALRKALAPQGEWLRRADWQRLLDSGEVDRAVKGELSLEGLADACLAGREAPVPRPDRELLCELAEARKRAQTLIMLVARALGRDGGITTFRSEHLGGTLLLPEEMPRWIAEQRRLEGATEIAAHAGSEDLSGEGPLVLEYETLAGERCQLAVPSGGILARLKTLVAGEGGVCALSGWPERAAVSFVLCGTVPQGTAASARVRHTVYPFADRIELDISTSMSPKEVAALYQQVRVATRGVQESPMSDRQLALALFADEHSGSDLGWRALRERWNKLHPQWRYEPDEDPEANSFGSQAKRAWSRLTGAHLPDLRSERLRRYGTAHPQGYRPRRDQPGRLPSPEVREKRLALASFLDEVNDEDLSWAELRKRWNHLHPEWSYATAATPRDDERFSMDARRAWSQVAGKSWKATHDKRAYGSRSPASASALAAKRVALAGFIEEANEEVLSWSKLRERWNELHPEWRYETAAGSQDDERFSAEARKAWSGATGSSWSELHDKRKLRWKRETSADAPSSA